ncbi:hypothetical protein OAO87_03865, partial [bacterium]|nr:hypothetical protein [bacterium]
AGDGTNVLVINKDITIRAQNSGRAIIDGEGRGRVIYVESSTVSLEGLQIINGRSGSVRKLSQFWTFLPSPMGCLLFSSTHWDALLTRFAVKSRLHRTYAVIQTQTPSQRPDGVLAFDTMFLLAGRWCPHQWWQRYV